MRQRLAKLISNILNPFLVSFIVTELLTANSTSSVANVNKWSLIAIALSVLPVFTIIVYLVRGKQLDGIFINPLRQRNRIYLMAIGFAVIGCAVLFMLEAPDLLMASFVSGLTAVVVFMVINLFWKISLHIAFVSASVTVLIIIYGGIIAWTLVFLPLVAWARIEMKLHTAEQVATGAILAAGIILVVFQLFGIIGS